MTSATMGAPSRKCRRRRTFDLRVLAVVLAGVTGCETATGPSASVQPGFTNGGSGQLGPPRLIVSGNIAVGRTIDPIVDLGPLVPDTAARNVALFRSSDARIIIVNPDGTLSARSVGSSTVTVNVDGLFDSVRVQVIPGLTTKVIPLREPLELTAVNDGGDVIGTQAGIGVLIRNGAVTVIPNCKPNAINNFAQVACDIPIDPCPGTQLEPTSPGLYSGGIVTPLFPGVHGSTTGINDSTMVLGTLVQCPTATASGSVDYFLGRSGSLQRRQFPWFTSLANTGRLNNRGVGTLQWETGGSYQPYVVTSVGIIHLEGGSSHSPVTGSVVDINDVNDAIGSVDPDRSPTVPAEWNGIQMPESGVVGQITDWPVTGVGDGRCYPSVITDRNQIFGTEWGSSRHPHCLYEMDGVHNIPEQMVSLAVQPGWTIDWSEYVVSRNGLIVTRAHDSSGAAGIVLIQS